MQAILAGAPVAVLLAFCVLLGAGALDGPAAVTLAWAVLGGLAAGLAYELPARGAEAGVLRRERFAGLSTAVFVLAKAAVLLPVLALADALILAVPAIEPPAGRVRPGVPGRAARLGRRAGRRARRAGARGPTLISPGSLRGRRQASWSAAWRAWLLSAVVAVAESLTRIS